MGRKLIDPTSLRFTLTLDGLVGLECDDLGEREQIGVWGPNGYRPPVTFSDLVDELLMIVSATPADTDAARLKSLAHDLKASHEKVEMVLSRLD